MAIIRSRTLASENPAVAGGNLTRAMQDVRAQVMKAREEGREAAMRDAQERIAAADARTAKVNAEVQAEYEGRFAPVLSALAQATAALPQFENKLIHSAEAEIVRLAVGIAERVVRRTIEVDPNWMREVVQEALRQIPDRRHVRVRMHPEDAALTRKHQQLLASSVQGLGDIEFVDDVNLPRGACVLESSGTTLDASALSSLERVTDEIKDMTPPGPFVTPAGTAQDVPVDPPAPDGKEGPA